MRISALLVSALLALTLTACGSDEAEDTTEVEDTTGTEETTSTESTGSEEEAAYVQIPVSIVNGTGVEIVEMYVSGDAVDSWGDDVLGDQTLPSGSYIDLTLNVDSANVLWDILVVDSEGTSVEFNSIDISQMPADGFGIELVIDGGTVLATPVADVADLSGDYTQA